MLCRVTKRCCISDKYITHNCDWVFYAKKRSHLPSSVPYAFSLSQKAVLDMTEFKTKPIVRYFDDKTRSSSEPFDYVFQVCEAKEPSTPTCTKSLGDDSQSDVHLRKTFGNGGNVDGDDENFDGGDLNADDGGDDNADGGNVDGDDENIDGGDDNADGGEGNADDNADGGNGNADGGDGNVDGGDD